MRFRLRGLFNPVVRLIALFLNRIGVGPNAASLIALFFAFSSIYFYYKGSLVPAALSIFFNGLIDGVDGELARISGRRSEWGAFLDSILDRYADAAIVLGAAVYLDIYSTQVLPISPYILAMLTITGFVMVSYTRARAEKEGLDLDVGLGARSERLLLLIIFTLLDQVYVGLIFLGLISNATAIYRLYIASLNMS